MSFEKTVKNATKAKAAPPKSKYLDHIIRATYSNDGSVSDICRALSSRLREPNSVIVFKSLLVLHSMIRSGSTDNVLDFLSSSPSDLLKLRNVITQNWDGYVPPKNLGYYAMYLDSRIRGYRELKHDPVRAQAENNRMSNYDGASTRARKLKNLSVDKGLLREVKAVLKMVDALLQVRFFEDDLSDSCTLLALKMLVKDLLILTQATNEGVVNLLEHYFEMAKTDATEALSIYKGFCKQTDKVVDYLNVARSLNNILEIPVPHLKHAPVSLVKALEEYLNDPNFEQNRIEYRQNMNAADIPASGPTSTSTANTNANANATRPTQSTAAATSTATTTEQPPPSSQTPSAHNTVNKTIEDFFASIEEDAKTEPHPNSQQQMLMQMQSQQPQMTGQANYMAPALGSYGQQQPMVNPFRQSTMMTPQMTGPGGFAQLSMAGPMQQQPTGMGQFGWVGNGNSVNANANANAGSISSMRQGQDGGFIQPQATGMTAFGSNMGGGGSFLQPHATGFNQMPQQQQQQQQQHQQPQQSFLQPQSTGMPFGGQQQQHQQQSPSALQPQNTGVNPFRQSMMFPQMTGMPTQTQNQNTAMNANGIPSMPTGLPTSSSPFQPSRQQSTSSTAAKSLIAQPTGSKNPFALPGDEERRKAREAAASQPTLFQLAQSSQSQPQHQHQQHAQLQSQPQYQAQQVNQSSNAQGSIMSDLASAFSAPPSRQNSAFVSDSTNADFSRIFGHGSMPSNTGLSSQPTGAGFGGLSSQPTGAGAGGGMEFLQPQATGFAGSSVKPFKPSSNFGSTLVDSLPPISSPPPTSPMKSQPTGSFNPFSGINSDQLQSQSTATSPGPSPWQSTFGTGGGNGPSINGGLNSSNSFDSGYNPNGSQQASLAIQPGQWK